MKTIEWSSCHLGYKKYTLEITDDNKNGNFTTELLDVETQPFNSLSDVILENLSKRGNRTAELLYSGGLDSEVTLMTCVRNKIPVRAITAKYIADGITINTYDLYYAEKFCREHNVEHKVIELDIKKFFESGEYGDYIWPYRIVQSHVAIHFWLMEQCSEFPIIGGDYTWPWCNIPMVSPARMPYTRYECFMRDRGIDGISEMLGYRLEGNLLIMKNHLELMRQYPDMPKLSQFRKQLYDSLGYSELEPRMRNYGFNNVDEEFNIHQYTTEGIKQFGDPIDYIDTIIWNKKIAEVLGGEPGTNNRYK